MDFDRVQSTLKSGQDVVTFLVRQRGAGRNDGTIFLADTSVTVTCTNGTGAHPSSAR